MPTGILDLVFAPDPVPINPVYCCFFWCVCSHRRQESCNDGRI